MVRICHFESIRLSCNVSISRVLLLYSSRIVGFDSAHLRANLPRLEEAYKYGISAGDRMYATFAAIATIDTRLYLCDHRMCFAFIHPWAAADRTTVKELLPSAKEVGKSLHDLKQFKTF